MNELPASGTSIIMISSELPEVLAHERSHPGDVAMAASWASLPIEEAQPGSWIMEDATMRSTRTPVGS